MVEYRLHAERYYDELYGRPEDRPPKPVKPSGSPSDLLRASDQPIDAEAFQRDLRIAKGVLVLEAELEKEKRAEADRAADWCSKSSLGQLMKG